jgi:serine/threonine-protein kinase
MLAAGALVGDRYRVGRTLGKGGMGVVVEATHVQLGTHVALKILKAESAEPANIERFMREARAAAKLRGENICRVHDFGTLPDGAPYMVMELLRGQDLATVLKASGPMDVALLSRYMLEVCAAIAEAHAAGIIHRDLKPGNLYVVERPDGIPFMKVLDFGIAKSVEKKDFALTDTTSVMGSPIYMSPEQLKSSKSVDTRSDIWSLGVVMYEMAVGKHPFNGETLTELAIAIANDPLPAFPERVPAAFAAVIIKCLEKDPAKRYQDVAALAAALEPLAKREASVAGAIKRTLDTGSVAAIPEGPATQPSLPSNLSTPDVTAKLDAGKGLARAISEVADEKKETTTLRGASGVMLAQTGDRPARRKWLLPAAGVLFAALAVGIGIGQLGGGDGDAATATSPAPAASPTPAAAPAPTPAPPSTDPAPPVVEPAKAKTTEPTKTETAEPAKTESAEPAKTETDPETSNDAVKTAEPKRPVKQPKKTGTTKKGSKPDLSQSRY